ncbi:hypothetical protein F2Q69_00049894 [Brassica cretica]|uniref:DUF223 domain-containing protein n=1 Tax=Brassica cretica TaxID=69181 RepID=A0A8S9PR89_BRACR|nr:hypothetical protein F2Q69_00049894 [Brassica cretica]
MKRFVIHGFTPVGRANHYMSSLKACSIVKVDRFDVARLFDNLQVIANTNLELSDVVGQIRSVQGSDLTKETTRVVIRLLIDPCSSMYKITDHPFLIRFISLTIIDEVITGAPEINLQSRLDYVVGQIRSVQGSDLTKETTRVVIRLLIDP